MPQFRFNFLRPKGLVPYFDSSFALNYQWNATPKLGLDSGGNIGEADFAGGNENGIAVPAQTIGLRDDRLYSVALLMGDHVI